MSQPQPLTYEVDHAAPAARVRLAGSLTSSSSGTLRNGLLDCLATQPTSVLLDVTGLSEIDQSGVSVLVDVARRNTQWPRATLVLYPATSEIGQQIRRGGAGRYLRLSADEAAAHESLADEPTPLRMERRLTPGVEAAAQARTVVATACQEWGLSHAVSTAQVVASELVSSAVLHAGTTLDLTLVLRDDGELGMAVHDHNPHPPRRWTPVRDADQVGRGLLLLDAFAHAWGSLPTGSGKTVWATVRT